MEPTKIKIEKLNDSNYSSWSYRCKLMMQEKNVWHVLSENKPEDDGSDGHAQALAAWKKANSTAMYLIASTVENNQLHLIKRTKTAQEAWKNIKSFHKVSTLGSGALNGKLIEEWRKLQTYLSRSERTEASRSERTETSRSERTEVSYNKPQYSGSSRMLEAHQLRSRIVKRENKAEDSDRNNTFFTNTHTLNTTTNKENWIIDSGASAHMCARKELFFTFDPSTKGTVTVANGKHVPALGTGDIKLTVDTGISHMPVTLRNVLWVPELNSNLISVNELGKKGHTVMFTGKECFIKTNNITNKVGENCNGMYKLNHTDEYKSNLTQPCDAEEPIYCIHEWHRKLAHRNLDDIKRMRSEGIKIKKCNHNNDCEDCMKGKMSRKPFQKAQPVEEPLDVIVSDVCGPLQTESVNRKRYFVTFTDVFSKYTNTFFLREKSEVTQIAIDYLEALHTQFGKWPKTFRSDRGKEYLNDRFQRYLTRRGIKSEFTVGYAPEQNGIAERKNRTLMEAARSMLSSSRLHKCLWSEAIRTANFVFNRVVNKITNKTPYESLHGRKHKFTKFYEFGTSCYIMIPDEKRRKLDDKATKARFLGYDEHSKGYRVLVGSRKIVVTREIRFMQNNQNSESSESDDEDIAEQETVSETPHEEKKIASKQTDKELNETGNTEFFDVQSELEDSESEEADSIIEEDDTILENTITPSGGDEPRWNFTRQNRGIPAQKYDPCNATEADIERDPRSYKEAINSRHREEWINAMEKELDTIEQNNTWKVTDLPRGKRTIGSKWVFKIKRDDKGNIKERKARLVAQGFSQKLGIDYNEVFAPVARGTTLRILLSIAGNRHYEVEHWDIASAFLNGELKEEIYMKPPPGINSEGKVLKLRKSLYGLKQAAHTWNQVLHNALVEMGFTQSDADKCLYSKHKEGSVVYLLIHVDDVIAASNSAEALESTRRRLGKCFQVKNLGGAKHYLGIDIERVDGKFFISQTSYIDSVIEEAGLKNAKVSKFPLDVGYFKIEETATQEQLKPLENNNEYRKLIGMILYLVVNTRPDIAASISILSKRVEKPRAIDLCELKRVIRYLKGTRELKLQLNDPRNDSGKLIAFSDANWAEDRTDRKSTSGHYCSLNGGTISWFSRKQGIISLSSCEAEYVALTETCKEITWIKEVLKSFDITITEPVTVYTDSQSCMAIIKNKKQGNRTKHIDIKYHYVKDQVESNKVKLT